MNRTNSIKTRSRICRFSGRVYWMAGVLAAGLLHSPLPVRAQFGPHLSVGDTRVTTNTAPVLDLNGGAAGIDFSVPYQPGTGPASIVDSSNLTVTDDAHHLVSATVTLTNNLDGALETLAANTAGTSISATLGPAGTTRTLTLSGLATKAEYQQVLRSVTYNNSSASASGSVRSVQFRVSDGGLQSAVATTTILIDPLQPGPNYIVNSSFDEDDGRCGVGHCTLREAINASNSNAAGSVITFASAVTGTIALQSTLGTLPVTSPISINGPGARILAVSGGNAMRIFDFNSGTSSISGLTIREGRVAGAFFGGSASGGGIINSANLTLTACTLSFNQAQGGNAFLSSTGGLANGGAINNQGVLTLSRCTLNGNSATGGDGGSITGGSGGDGGAGQGGAVFNEAGSTLTVQNCTFAGNLAGGGSGGGGSNAGNGGPGSGGGVFNEGILTITAATFRGNSASGGSRGSGTTTNGVSGVGNGGAIAAVSGTSTVRDTICAGNFRSGTGSGGADVDGAFNSGGFNLIGRTDGSTGFTAPSDLTGTDALPLDAGLGPLQNNGGPTDTMALIGGSLAIDAGSRFGLTTDQRLQVRPVDDPTATNAAGSDASDIGAFEVAPPATIKLIGSTFSTTENSGSVIITAVRSGDTTETSTVTYATGSGSATAGSDYTTVNGTLTFAPGVTTQAFSVPILNNATCEPIETLPVALGSPTAATLTPPTTGTLTIFDEDCTFTISGRVTNHSNVGMPGITVTRGATSVSTNANGDYTFTGIKQGNYVVNPVITPSLNGVTFSPSSLNVTVNTTNRTNINFLATFTVNGRVANHSGTGIPNVLVRRTQGASVVTTATNASGNYSFTGVRNGSYTVEPVLTPALSGMTFFPASTNITVDRSNLTNVNFIGSFSISGRIANHSGVGIPNVQVKRVSGGSTVSVFTNSSGNFVFTNVRSGNYTLSPVLTPALAGMTFSPSSLSVTVGTVSLTNQNFIGSFSVSGRITKSGNIAMANVLVRLATGGTSTTVLTNASGNYTFTNVRSGNYTITPTQSGKTFTPTSRSITVGTLSLTNQNFIGAP